MGDQSGGHAQAQHKSLADYRARETAGDQTMTIAPRTTGILPVSRPGRPWYEWTFAFLLSFSFSIWFAVAIGRNLGLFFAGLTLATILAPMIAGKNPLPCLSIVAAIALVWLSCVF